MYHTIFFDLDGTLTDSSEGIFKCFGYALDCMKAPPCRERLLYSAFLFIYLNNLIR